MSNPILLDLTKKFELNLEKAGITQTNIPTLRVFAAIDKSGSMDGNFRAGFVDKAVQLFLPLALKFDDNGEIEVGFFNNYYHEAPVATAADVTGYLSRSGERADGGTSFAPIVEFISEASKPQTAAAQVVEKAGNFLSKLFGGKKEAAPAPAPSTAPNCRSYAAIITDGDNFDKREFEKALAAEDGNVFYQFIAIGTGVTESYLAGIASKYANVAFFTIRDPLAINEDDFYAKIVNEKFTAWM